MPHFWSDQYHVEMQMLGVSDGHDSVAVVEGSSDRWDFVAAYGRAGRVIAVLSTIPGRVHDCGDAVAQTARFSFEVQC